MASGPQSVRTVEWRTAAKTMTFAGGTANDPGDYDGTGNPATLFTVTGVVEMRIIGKCTTELAGASATLEVGTATDTDALIATTTGTDIDANELWNDASPTDSVEALQTALTVSQNVIQTAGVANITAGVIVYFVQWRAISADGLVKPA